MNITEHITKSNKKITVYDGGVEFHHMQKMFDYFTNSMYSVKGYDALYRDYQLFSKFNLDDIIRCGFYDTEAFKSIDKQYNIMNQDVKQIRVNFSNSAERNRIHEDNVGFTILYYGTLKWDIEWGGHTLFMDDNLENVEYTSLYKPGKVVVFDGTIPHMIMTPSIVSEFPRFSLALQIGEIK
jgi:hypothetical protein